eukprot:7917865-Ditylum_brightwellii.AAC.1
MMCKIMRTGTMCNTGAWHGMQQVSVPMVQPQPSSFTHPSNVLTPEQKLVMQQDMMEREHQASVVVAVYMEQVS